MSLIVLICLIGAIVVVAGILVYSFYKDRKRDRAENDPDYRLFFRIGMSFIIIGLIFLILAFTTDLAYLTTIPLFIIGVIYTALGWNKRDTWL
ncbi:MAG: hypothetical protein JW762_02510 [Dehalococcoidales bacterium]|nr:hypothetical protein [Dehalococcoidales bacterium]